MIHVYGLTEIGGSSPGLRGIEDRPVRRVAGAFASAVVSEHPTAPAPDAEVLLRHAQVVEQLLTAGPVLPARFGTGALDEAEVRERLADPDLPDAFDRVRGRLEIAVRVVTASDPPTRSSPGEPTPRDADDPGDTEPRTSRSGREHLARLAARRASLESRRSESDRRIATTRARLERLADDVVQRPPGSSRVLWHAALLVPADDREAFEAAVAEAAADLAPDLAVLCTGPWPPYNFTPDRTTDRSGTVERSGA